jgi:hypothetical protein
MGGAWSHEKFISEIQKPFPNNDEIMKYLIISDLPGCGQVYDDCELLFKNIMSSDQKKILEKWLQSDDGDRFIESTYTYDRNNYKVIGSIEYEKYKNVVDIFSLYLKVTSPTNACKLLQALLISYANIVWGRGYYEQCRDMFVKLYVSIKKNEKIQFMKINSYRFYTDMFHKFIINNFTNVSVMKSIDCFLCSIEGFILLKTFISENLINKSQIPIGTEIIQLYFDKYDLCKVYTFYKKWITTDYADWHLKSKTCLTHILQNKILNEDELIKYINSEYINAIAPDEKLMSDILNYFKDDNKLINCMNSNYITGFVPSEKIMEDLIKYFKYKKYIKIFAESKIFEEWYMKSKHGFIIILLNEIFDDEKLKNYLNSKYVKSIIHNNKNLFLNSINYSKDIEHVRIFLFDSIYSKIFSEWFFSWIKTSDYVEWITTSEGYEFVNNDIKSYIINNLNNNRYNTNVVVGEVIENHYR